MTDFNKHKELCKLECCLEINPLKTVKCIYGCEIWETVRGPTVEGLHYIGYRL